MATELIYCGTKVSRAHTGWNRDPRLGICGCQGLYPVLRAPAFVTYIFMVPRSQTNNDFSSIAAQSVANEGKATDRSHGVPL